MERRNFIKDLAISCAAGTVAAKVALGAEKFLPSDKRDIDDINASRIPRWRGFNLQGNFALPGQPNRDRHLMNSTLPRWPSGGSTLPVCLYRIGCGVEKMTGP